ncbi:aluminum-activated malate transporter 6 isoform X2 [Lolium perenne]|uniref:aluminum-activated malate transporter 6 isoform X2 n=1 Tax=Lolium perenne TaxID=4522 RepID=UPI0021F57FEB|nr:aluminum-activated malate transporter 4-like isoform X2 [Lolium perenne]
MAAHPQWSEPEDQGSVPLLTSAWILPDTDEQPKKRAGAALARWWGAMRAAQAKVWAFALADGDERRKKGPLRRALAAAALWFGATCAAAAELRALARADPRKPVFALKVSLALVLISLIGFLREPREIVDHTMWAILTAVLVFEFSIGETLSRGLNRGLGTITAGGLAIAVALLATHLGQLEKLILIVSTFVVGFFTNLVKLHPKMMPYEHGFRVFLMTFGYLLVSGYNTGTFTETALYRFVMVAIGAAISVAINICICPIWAGEDLHNLIAENFAGVAKSLEGCVDGYLKCMEYKRIPSTILAYQASDDPLYSGYRAAFEASAREETLVWSCSMFTTYTWIIFSSILGQCSRMCLQLGFALWEPRHGPYKMKNCPWKSFTKVSGALRHCSFAVIALHGCILSEIQATPDNRRIFATEIQKVGKEGAKVLRELGDKVKTMTKLSSSDILADVYFAAEELQGKIDEKSYLFVNTQMWDSSIQAKGIEEAIDGVRAVEKEKKNDVRPLLFCPARGSFHPNLHESATALSLATFTSLLIEFVARLQNIVDAFEELSDKANFKEPLADSVLLPHCHSVTQQGPPFF